MNVKTKSTNLPKKPALAIPLDRLESQAVSATQTVGECVKNYPGLCLASAFAIGVTCAWWLKQM